MAATTTHDDGLRKPAGRLGQVALFWGALQLAVAALDAHTKWETLPTLRDSIGPELAVAVGLRAGLFLVALSSALIWTSLRPKKAPALSLIERLQEREQEETREEEKPPSLLHLAAVPVFLAIVCAGVFWGVESRYPPPDSKRRAFSQVPTHDLRPLLQRRLLSSDDSSLPPTANERSANKVRAFMVSLFASSRSARGAEPDGSGEAGSASDAAKPDRSATSPSILSGAQDQAGLLQKAYHAARDLSTTADGQASSPCTKRPAVAGKDGSSGRPCDTGQGSGAPSTVWQFEPPNSSTNKLCRGALGLSWPRTRIAEGAASIAPTARPSIRPGC